MIVPSVGILILQKDQVLLVRHESGSGYADHVYGLPSGRLKQEEKEITAAIRELREETGLETSEHSLIEFPNNYFIAKLPNRKNPKEREIEYGWRVFLCKNFSGKLTPSKETTPEWVNLNELPNKYLIVNVKNAIEAGIKFIQQNSL
jgi:ADP-ribose pyrophosphatase YjhB (NUDIX family)